MKKQFIIVGHGEYASGVKSTLELIAGKSEKTEFIDYLEGMTTKDLEHKINKYINLKGTIIICDILGGTPFKVASRLSVKSENIFVLSGININGIMEGILQSDDTNIKAVVNTLIEKTKKTARVFEMVKKVRKEKI